MTTASPLSAIESVQPRHAKTMHVRLQMPVNMAVQEPRARVVSDKSECDIIASTADAHDIPTNRDSIVVGRAARNAHNIKCMAMKMERVL